MLKLAILTPKISMCSILPNYFELKITKKCPSGKMIAESTTTKGGGCLQVFLCLALQKGLPGARAAASQVENRDYE